MRKYILIYSIIVVVSLVSLSFGWMDGVGRTDEHRILQQAGEDQVPVSFVLHLPRVELKVGLKQKTVVINSGRFALSLGAGFVVKQVKANIYHIMRRDWESNFWAVNTMRREVYTVTRGTFGEEGGHEKLLRTRVETRGNRNLPTEFSLLFRSTRLEYHPEINSIKMTCDGGIVSLGEELEMIKVKPQIFQLRGEAWQDSHWEIRTYEKKLYVVTESEFGTIGGKASPLMYNIDVEY
ncbi:hypothetical protein ACFLT9_02660 [Acidobacteriota bacterium]